MATSALICATVIKGQIIPAIGCMAVGALTIKMIRGRSVALVANRIASMVKGNIPPVIGNVAV